MRVMFTKESCPFCLEALRAVNIFNAGHPKDIIKVVDTGMPAYRKYRDFLIEATGGVFNTPFLVFDWIIVRSSSGWREMLAYLERLHELKSAGG